MLVDFVIRYFVEILCGVLVGVLSYFMKRVLGKIKRLELVEGGMQALLRDRIIQIYNHCMDRGFCPIYERENAEKLYTQYHALGGNGTVTDLMTKLKALPTEKIENECGGDNS